MATPVPQHVMSHLWLYPSSSLARTMAGHHWCAPVKILFHTKYRSCHIADLTLKGFGSHHIESIKSIKLNLDLLCHRDSQILSSAEIITRLQQLELKFNVSVRMKIWCTKKPIYLPRHDKKLMQEKPNTFKYLLLKLNKNVHFNHVLSNTNKLAFMVKRKIASYCKVLKVIIRLCFE